MSLSYIEENKGDFVASFILTSEKSRFRLLCTPSYNEPKSPGIQQEALQEPFEKKGKSLGIHKRSILEWQMVRCLALIRIYNWINCLWISLFYIHLYDLIISPSCAFDGRGGKVLEFHSPNRGARGGGGGGMRKNFPDFGMGLVFHAWPARRRKFYAGWIFQT